MALPKTMSIEKLKEKNAASQKGRAAEKSGSTPTSPQQKGR
ncbi:hypothetical protein ACFWAF_14915 [Streptomyces microflavus]